MPGATLTIAELADEIGRSESWVYQHWRDEARHKRLPWPLHEGEKPFVWSRAQVYAYLDAKLAPAQKLAAQAYRAAAAAAAGAPHVDSQMVQEAEWRSRLDARFGGSAA